MLATIEQTNADPNLAIEITKQLRQENIHDNETIEQLNQVIEREANRANHWSKKIKAVKLFNIQL